jgi:hypothetical protein
MLRDVLPDDVAELTALLSALLTLELMVDVDEVDIARLLMALLVYAHRPMIMRTG